MDEKIIKRQHEFAKLYKDRLISCLVQDEMYAELAFACIGMDLFIRCHDITEITWEQVDFSNNKIINIVNRKETYKYKQNIYYEDRDISKVLLEALHKIKTNDSTGKIFNHYSAFYIDKIKHSIGDYSFHNIDLRYIGLGLLSGGSRL